ncbi:hypothetical protein CVT25_009507 [Psilocybe cyanescens]|uniref:F-box domain-containing protein n=1 Tax=Psilocybe cyanescens TaxID=93625 RepID=A0A409XAT5_PSICY|nr:hypothetical protein CVT25_009507 [Psilocybe cyanescens]
MGQLHSIYNRFNSFLTAPLLFIQRLTFCEQKLLEEPRSPDTTKTPTTLQSLPVEIILHVFSFLELKPYIISHGVCNEWQRLLPLAELHPTRRRLLTLYYRIVNTPHFQNSLIWSLDNLHPFDRQAYIDSLLAQYPMIPEEFRMWIIEWPARLVIACIWPGIRLLNSRGSDCQRRYGVNWLGYKNNSPQLSAVLYKNKTPHVKFIPALLIWRQSCTTDWLIFAEDEPDLFGRVYTTDFMESETSAVIPYARQSLNYNDDSDNSDDVSDYYHNVPYADWVSYLEYHWENTARILLVSEMRLNECPFPDWPILQPVPIDFDEAQPDTLPAYPWNFCDTVSHLALFS